jgi:hypothetical protein
MRIPWNSLKTPIYGEGRPMAPRNLRGLEANEKRDFRFEGTTNYMA